MIYQIYLLDIYSKFCDLDTFMRRYKLVRISPKCETVSDKLKSKVLLYSCFCLEVTAQSEKKPQHEQILFQSPEIKPPVFWLEKDCCIAFFSPNATPMTKGLWQSSCLEDRDHWQMALVCHTRTSSSKVRYKAGYLPVQPSYSCDHDSSICSLHIVSI